MNDATRRTTLRRAHILMGIGLGIFLYSPLSTMPEARAVVLYGLFPLIGMTGFFLWQRGRLKQFFARRRNQAHERSVS